MATCKYCGTNDLLWEQSPSGKWFFTTQAGDFHDCPKRRNGDRPSMQQSLKPTKFRTACMFVDAMGIDDVLALIAYAAGKAKDKVRQEHGQRVLETGGSQGELPLTQGCPIPRSRVPDQRQQDGGGRVQRESGLVRDEPGAGDAPVPEDGEPPLPF